MESVSIRFENIYRIFMTLSLDICAYVFRGYDKNDINSIRNQFTSEIAHLSSIHKSGEKNTP